MICHRAMQDSDFDKFYVQDQPKYAVNDYFAKMEKLGPCISIVDDTNEEVIAIAGYHDFYDSRACVWMIMNNNNIDFSVRLFVRCIRNALCYYPRLRVEAVIQLPSENLEIRLAKVCGFHVEAEKMPNYLPCDHNLVAADACLMSRINYNYFMEG